MASQQQTSNTPPALRDSWQTPDWLFNAAAARFDFVLDLAASVDNKKCGHWFGESSDSLSQSWADSNSIHGGWCWLNPPYSETGKWLEKCWEEAQLGARIVCLVPSPNGESYWGKYVFNKASEIIFINGRVAFELPGEDGKPKAQKGNTRGSCLVVFNRTYEAGTLLTSVDREKLIAENENEAP